MGMQVPDFLTQEEADALLDVPNRRYVSGRRNYYLIRFLLGTGLRAAECVEVRVADLDLRKRRLMVRNGKRRPGEKHPRKRTVALSQSMADAMELYLSKRATECDYLFCTSKGTPLDTSYLRHMLLRYGKRAGIGRNVHPHLLRHTYGTWLYDEGVPVTTIQSQLGHDRLATTSIYAHASGKRAAEDVADLRF